MGPGPACWAVLSRPALLKPADNPLHCPMIFIYLRLLVLSTAVLVSGCTGFHRAWYMRSTTFRPSAVYSQAAPLRGVNARYVKLADQAGHYYAVPPALILAVCDEESGFNAKAVSSTGAEGLMQLMPDTAAQMGVSRPFNAKQAIWGGTRYLALLLHRYSDNIRLALAAYHSGAETVSRTNDRIPQRSRSYVARVLAKYRYFSRFQKTKTRITSQTTDANSGTLE